MIKNNEVMAKNLKRLMSEKGVNATQVCRALNLKPNTFSDYINAKVYPRIDKIELLASYFGVLKSSLVEDSENIVLSPKEQKLVLSYRGSDKTTRSIVDKILLKDDSSEL